MHSIPGIFELTPVLWVFLGVTGVVHLLFAIAIGSDMRILESQGKEVIFGPPLLWILATLLGGVPIVGVYWLINRSRLRPD